MTDLILNRFDMGRVALLRAERALQGNAVCEAFGFFLVLEENRRGG